MFIVCGLIGSFVHAILLDKYKRFRFQYLIVLYSSLLTFGLFIGGLFIGNKGIMATVMGAYGFTLLPIIGIGMSFASMEFFPISAPTICGVIQISNCLI